ncbi:MAG: VOC family protein [Nostocaceae cyanobacterium]|nr:VOC family protein [Nostocaceae cyanobacterium]
MVFQCSDAIVTIATVNFEKLVHFYTEFLCANPTQFIPNIYAEFQLPSVKLGIFQPKETHISEFENSAQGKMSLCLEVSNLENAIAHISDLGYPPPGKIINASHGKEIYAYDPDGNRLILHQAATSDN